MQPGDASLPVLVPGPFSTRCRDSARVVRRLLFALAVGLRGGEGKRWGASLPPVLTTDDHCAMSPPARGTVLVDGTGRSGRKSRRCG